mmetsp:Transcript_23933/g.40656  ORF Transcript_23933/g.40656 Transcript_23933/m.40656 type:complete len:210 (-) Transcript_23933:617-1246(-)
MPLHAMLSFKSLIVLALISLAHAAMTDPSTGIAFNPKVGGLDIFGVGVRKKGPIKVYSVAMYCTQGVRDALSSLSRSADKGKEALKELQSGAKDNDTTFLLQMNFKVGAEKMASSIAEAVSPRYSGSESDVDELKGLIFNGIEAKGSAVKGTTFQFDCSSGGISVKVDGKDQGAVSSGALAKSFCDVYLDDKAVSPSLKTSCLENCCGP